MAGDGKAVAVARGRPAASCKEVGRSGERKCSDGRLCLWNISRPSLRTGEAAVRVEHVPLPSRDCSAPCTASRAIPTPGISRPGCRRTSGARSRCAGPRWRRARCRASGSRPRRSVDGRGARPMSGPMDIHPASLWQLTAAGLLRQTKRSQRAWRAGCARPDELLRLLITSSRRPPSARRGH